MVQTSTMKKQEDNEDENQQSSRGEEDGATQESANTCDNAKPQVSLSPTHTLLSGSQIHH